jgi:predicted nucleotidyltransferase
VRFEKGTSLLDLAGLEEELTEILGIDVDVVSEGGLRLPKHQSILDNARHM